jgi:ADP-dependent NAD(P)H-hydrate dehydratase
MTATITPLDSAWIAANPVPVHSRGTTKNSRGRVLVIGGSRLVPGALRLTGEAALRVGAGKLRLATIASAAPLLGMFVPEAATLSLPEDQSGEIGQGVEQILEEALHAFDSVVIGPGMVSSEAATDILSVILQELGDEQHLVIDAAAISAMKKLRAYVEAHSERIVVTPHHGEMAAWTGLSDSAVEADAQQIAVQVSSDYGVTIVLKGSDTVIASSAEAPLHYAGGGTGLATAGSGDVLAGAIGGLLARGATPFLASGWGVWLHGQSGRRVATTDGPIGFLARDISSEFPRLLPQ